MGGSLAAFHPVCWRFLFFSPAGRESSQCRNKTSSRSHLHTKERPNNHSGEQSFPKRLLDSHSKATYRLIYCIFFLNTCGRYRSIGLSLLGDFLHQAVGVPLHGDGFHLSGVARKCVFVRCHLKVAQMICWLFNRAACCFFLGRSLVRSLRRSK